MAHKSLNILRYVFAFVICVLPIFIYTYLHVMLIGVLLGP